MTEHPRSVAEHVIEVEVEGPVGVTQVEVLTQDVIDVRAIAHAVTLEKLWGFLTHSLLYRLR